jgi:hypothetical protein
MADSLAHNQLHPDFIPYCKLKAAELKLGKEPISFGILGLRNSQECLASPRRADNNFAQLRLETRNSKLPGLRQPPRGADARGPNRTARAETRRQQASDLC